VPGVTLLGDAANRSPPNGEGANLAMYDGDDAPRSLINLLTGHDQAP
jgi:2-polyprenyl-6-methoxyphenol hydroxylase-like FAD-dependent oxidoreductase